MAPPPGTMDAPPRPDRRLALAALSRQIPGAAGGTLHVKHEPANDLPQTLTPTAQAPARSSATRLIDMTKPEPNPTPAAFPQAATPLATQYNSIVNTKPQGCPLLRLPDSIRIRILRLAVVSHIPIKVQRRPFAAEANILLTCKQLRKDAQLIFWAENTFQCRDAVYVCISKPRPVQVLYQRQLSVLLEWLDRIGKEKASLIKKSRIDYDEDCQFNGHPKYQSNWPATAEDIMKEKKMDLAAAARFAAIKMLRGLLFHGVPLDAIKPVPIVKGVLRDGQGDRFGALWKVSVEEVIALLKMPQ